MVVVEMTMVSTATLVMVMVVMDVLQAVVVAVVLFLVRIAMTQITETRGYANHRKLLASPILIALTR